MALSGGSPLVNAKTGRTGVIGLIVGVAGAGGIATAVVLSDSPSNSTPSRRPGQVQPAADQSSTAPTSVVEHAPPPVVRRTKADDPTYVAPG